MEIQLKSISLEDRLIYLKSISEKPETAPNVFPWGMIIVSVLVGVGIGYAIIQNKRNREANKSYHSLGY